MKPALPLACAALLCGAGALAKTEAPAAGSPVGSSVESCVASGRIDFSPADQTALLDAADLKTVHAEMLRLYPALARDGFAATHILLWQRPGAELVYLTLLADPQGERRYCFTASVVAATLAPTPVLRRKYFFPVEPAAAAR